MKKLVLIVLSILFVGSVAVFVLYGNASNRKRQQIQVALDEFLVAAREQDAEKVTALWDDDVWVHGVTSVEAFLRRFEDWYKHYSFVELERVVVWPRMTFVGGRCGFEYDIDESVGKPFQIPFTAQLEFIDGGWKIVDFSLFISNYFLST